MSSAWKTTYYVCCCVHSLEGADAGIFLTAQDARESFLPERERQHAENTGLHSSGLSCGIWLLASWPGKLFRWLQGLACSQDLECSAHWCKVRQKHGGIHVFGTFFLSQSCTVYLHGLFREWGFTELDRKWFWTVRQKQWSKERCVLPVHAELLITVCHSNLSYTIITELLSRKDIVVFLFSFLF